MWFIRTTLLLTGCLSLFLAPIAAIADDADDVLAVVKQWAAMENDLEGQAALIRDDRIQIFEMSRQTDQELNLRTQIAQEKARRAVDPDGFVIVGVESPIVRVYGNSAVVSFQRSFVVIPGNAAPSGPPGLSMMSLVLVKERGEWKIAHLHGSAN